MHRHQTQVLEAIVLDEPIAPPISTERLAWINQRSNPYQAPQTYNQRQRTPSYWALGILIALCGLTVIAAALLGYLDATYSITGNFDR